jgi:hypothetical protein
MIITDHGLKRGKQRLGLSKQAIQKTAARALAEGVTHAEAVGQLKKYFDKLYFHNQSANNIRIWGDHVYIFRYDKLITVFPMPHTLKNRIKKIMKRRKI